MNAADGTSSSPSPSHGSNAPTSGKRNPSIRSRPAFLVVRMPSSSTFGSERRDAQGRNAIRRVVATKRVPHSPTHTFGSRQPLPLPPVRPSRGSSPPRRPKPSYGGRRVPDPRSFLDLHMVRSKEALDPRRKEQDRRRGGLLFPSPPPRPRGKRRDLSSAGPVARKEVSQPRDGGFVAGFRIHPGRGSKRVGSIRAIPHRHVGGLT